jgi:Domain of unknown function (DUF4262)
MKHPMTDKQRKEYFDKVDKNIKESGYHLTNVFASKNSPSFFYSTGIYKTFGIPEIFISSLPSGLCSELVRNYVKSFKDKQVIPLNEKLDYLSDRFSVYLIEVATSKLSDYVLSSVRLYKDEDYKYLQIIFPDTKGCFPNDIGYNYDQEIIGKFGN